MKIALADSAKHLRITLSVTILLLVVSAGVGIFFIVQALKDYAAIVRTETFAAQTSEDTIKNIELLTKQMDSDPKSVANVQAIVADSKQYLYQDVIIEDLRAMAARAGLSINSFTFVAAGSTGTANTSTVTPSTTEVAPPVQGSPSIVSQGAGAQSTTPVAALKSTKVDVALAPPVTYESFLRFVHYVEQNNTKMQISSIGLSTSSNGTVTSENLTIEVYIR